MPVVIPPPDPAGLPAPAWLLQILLVFTFILHILAMNLLVGGTTIMAIGLRKGKHSPFHAELAKRLSRALPVVMSFTITLGIAPLLFVQVLYGQAFYTASILMAWPWLSVVALVLLAYYGLYLVQFRPDWLGRWVTPIAWMSALFILLVGLLYTHNATLKLTPEKWAPMYDASPAGLHLNWSEPTLIPRYLHFMVAAFAVAGLGIALLGLLARKRGDSWGDEAVRYGAKWFIGATLVQLGVGLWFLFSLPSNFLQSFIGGNTVNTVVLWAGVLAAVLGLLLVNRSLPGAVLLTVVAITLMSVTRHSLRQMYLQPHIDVNTIPVNPQWGVFIIFAVLLVIGLATVGWMVWQFYQAGEPKQAAASQ
ncbi:MAG: hypothetical protein RMM06_00485 [Armatimonadota bacterium]|nr:hypothetical protein [bacterium]MDW8289169.1 hypothetical protein [Armatimonadota bacterium]